MKQLYIGNKNYSSWSLRPAVLMRSLEIPFEEVLVPFDGPDNYQRYKAFSPNGRVPCLHDDNEIIWDSLAIIEYLGERNKQVWPTSGPARAFARSASSEMHAGFHVLRAHCPMICSAQFRIRELSPGLRRDLSRLDDLFCEGLTRFGGDFLSGARFSAVDAFFCPVAIRVVNYALQLSQPSLDYCHRLLALDAMRDWMSAARKEPWFDETEEATARIHADFLEDKRTLI